MRKSHVSRENLMSKEYLISYHFWPPLMRKSPVSRENLWSQEKISCLFSIYSPPNKKISCLLSHEKISCPKRKSQVFSVFGLLPTKKSSVSCLMRKSHVSRENLISYQFWAPPKEKISCLLSNEKISHTAHFFIS